DGTRARTISGPIGPAQSVSLCPITRVPGPPEVPFTWRSEGDNLLEAFEGSAVMSSTRSVTALVDLVNRELVNPAARAVGTYTGLPAGASKVVLPIVRRQDSGGVNVLASWFSVQNPNDSLAAFNVEYRPAILDDQGTLGGTGFFDFVPTFLEPHGSKDVFLRSLTQLGSGFPGRAVIRSLSPPALPAPQQDTSEDPHRVSS